MSGYYLYCPSCGEYMGSLGADDCHLCGWSMGRQEDDKPKKQPPEYDDLINALADCRDAFPVPEEGSDLDRLWMQSMSDPDCSVPIYVKAQKEAADKVLTEVLTLLDWLSEMVIMDQVIRTDGEERNPDNEVDNMRAKVRAFMKGRVK